MKVIEILNFNRELLKRLQAAGIRLEDARYIDLYADYTRLLDQGEKVSYVCGRIVRKVFGERTQGLCLGETIPERLQDCLQCERVVLRRFRACRFPLSLGSFKF